MNLDTYQTETARTDRQAPFSEAVANHAMGLAGETGELVDALKKLLFHGHEVEQERVRNELGDVLWYVARIAADFGLTLSEVADANIAKLRARYPDGFSTEASIARVDAQPPRGCANEVPDGAGQGAGEIVQQEGTERVGWDSECPEPWRKGRHEWYGAPRSGFVCRACGARSTAPGWDANGSEVR